MAKEWITAAEAARRLGLSRERVSRLCQQGRIRGAQKVGPIWVIPVGAEIEPPPRAGRVGKIPRKRP